MTTTKPTSTHTEEPTTMHPLSPVLAPADGLELSPATSTTILEAVQHYLRGAAEHAIIRPYVAGEHLAPVRAPEPITVVTGVKVEQHDDDDYVVTVSGACYREDYGAAHPLSELFQRRGRKGAHGLTTIPAWEDVRIGDAHIIGRRDNTGGGHVLPSGILTSRLDIALRIVVGQQSVDSEVKPRHEPVEVPIVAYRSEGQQSPARLAHVGRRAYRPVVDMADA